MRKMGLNELRKKFSLLRNERPFRIKFLPNLKSKQFILLN